MTGTITVIEPAAAVIDLDAAKRHLRVEGNEDNDYIEGLIATAQAHIDGPSGWLGRSIGPQLLQYSAWFGCGRIRLPCAPVIEIDSVVAETSDGGEITVDPSSYRLDGGYLVLNPGASWATQAIHRIRYRAGYDGEAVADGGTGDAPPPIIHAMLLLIAHYYDNRGGTNSGGPPAAVDVLLWPYRVFL